MIMEHYICAEPVSYQYAPAKHFQARQDHHCSMYPLIDIRLNFRSSPCKPLLEN